MTLLSDVILHIALPVPLRRLFDYLLPVDVFDHENEINDLSELVGCRVVVPFGRQTLIGIVMAADTETDQDVGKLKAVQEIIETAPTIDSELNELLTWAANYYQHPIGDVMSAAIPGSLRSNKSIRSQLPQSLVKTDDLPTIESLNKNAKQIIKLCNLLAEKNYTRAELTELGIPSTTIKKFVDNEWATWEVDQTAAEPKPIDDEAIKEGLQLNTEQALAVTAIDATNHHQCFLLDGVTGSGKTEVYLQAIAAKLRKGHQVLVCVPEIGLTPQTIKRFKQRFDVTVALWHSGMTDKQRFETWHQCRSGTAKIVIATRSGIFLPFKSLGMIIIDEEHDASFKQQEGFKYHCRSLALYRAHKANIPVVLGSATPSLESLSNVEQGKLAYCH